MAFESRQTDAGGAGPRRFGRWLARAPARIEMWLEAERTQLPLWLPVGVIAGIAAWFALPGPRAWAGFCLGAAAVATAALTMLRGGRLGPALVWFALAMLVGCGLVWGKAERVAAPRLDRPRVMRFVARVERVEPLPARQAVRVVLIPDPASGLPRTRLSIPDADGTEGLAPGAWVRVRARLMPPPAAAVPGAYDFARVAWFAGIGATGRALEPVRVVAPAPAATTPSLWLADVRIALTRHILNRLPGGEGGVAAALATGDMGGVTRDDSEAFRRSGLAHLLSVSGLHLTAVVGAAMLLSLRLMALWPGLALRAPLPLIAAVVGGCAGLAYTLLTGAEVPTVRSLIAALIVLLGLGLGRDAMTLRLVAAGALVCALLWPDSVAGPSFEMSFAAILSIVSLHELRWTQRMFGPREESWWRRVLRSTVAVLLTGLVVEAALAPIAAFHFHRAGLYGSFANIVAIPLTTFVIMPAEGLALLADIAGLGAPFWWVAGRALALLLAIAHHVGSLPGAVGFVPAMSRSAFALLVGGGLWLALWRTRIRLLGLLPVMVGAMLAWSAQPADIFVTGDGRHMAVGGPGGQVALLRERSGDYMRDTLSELSGRESDEAVPLDDLPGAVCGPDSCAAVLIRNDRPWRLLATRSVYHIDRPAMERACAAADIVVSDRRLPSWCRPRWLKADARMLAATGGLAIHLTSPRIDTVARWQGNHPWAMPLRSVSSDGAARPIGPAPSPDPRHSASADRRDWPDRGG